MTWYERLCSAKSRGYGERHSIDEPMATVCTVGIGGSGAGGGDWYWVRDDKFEQPMKTNKPPYSVPSMKTIARMPWNGFKVVSTFSGCGGSSLGYKMAGYRVLWANEFIPAAQETYEANHPNTILDKRDIRTIQPQDILNATGLRRGELDLFDGSPPCASFSMAGIREEGWGKVKKYCVFPLSKILRADLRWANAERISVGDELIGFDEEVKNHRRLFRRTRVLSTKKLVEDCVQIYADRRSTICSKMHRWLVKSGGNLRWKRAYQLEVGDRLISIGKPWDDASSFDAGWLSGIFDGEGCVSKSTPGKGRARVLSVAQNDGVVLENIKRVLKSLDFSFIERKGKCPSIRFNKPWEKIRFLGSVRPHRLLAKASKLWDGLSVRTAEKVAITKIKNLGPTEVIAISTYDKTFISDGFLSHNSDTKQRTDDLFFEFARLVEGVQPKMFLAENVKGLTIGVAKDVLGDFQRDMFKEQDHTIIDTLMNMGYVVGYRVLNAADLGVPQSRPRVIFCGIRKDLAKKHKLEPTWPRPLMYRYTVRDAIPWIVRVADGKDSWAEADKSVSPAILASDGGRSTSSFDQGLGYVEAESDITKYCTGREWDKIKPGEASSKYFQLVKVDPDEPCPTICASHGSGGIASVVHPYEKRKFSIAELKRICGFPDDFILTGEYAKQWERLGRAVPPVMMMRIASHCMREILSKII